MSVNVKLGKNTINGVESVKLEDATTTGLYHEFSLGLSGVYKITLNVDDSVVSIINIVQGKSLTANPYTPQKNGNVFLGWTQTSGSTTTITYPFTPNADVTLYAVWQTGYKCTVSNLGASSPSTVSFNKDIGFTLQGLGIEEVTKGTDTFIKIPTMYRKVNTVASSQITSFTISNANLDGTYSPYSCFLDESGGLLPYILIGKYWNTNRNSCVSTSQTTVATMTLATGRTKAKGRGTGYQLFDWQMQKLWQDLIICFKETINTNSGTAWTTDELGIYWGTQYGWIDGVISGGGTWRFSYKPSEYVSLSATSDTIPISYNSASYSEPTSSNQIQKLGYDSNNQFFNYPSAVSSNSSYNSYYCDSFEYSSGNHPVRWGVGSAYASAGAFLCYAIDIWSDNYGVRLCYRPISE